MPEGESAIAAYARVAPSEKTSVAGVTAAPRTCSGARKPGEPTAVPTWVRVLAPVAQAMPKSMMRGPLGESRMFDGLRSRCTTPASWTATRPSESAAPMEATSAARSAPSSATRSCREGPGTYWVANQGRSASRSAATSRAVQPPRIRRAADTSRANRERNSWSSARSGRITLSATRWPRRSDPRYTTPIPPAPSLRWSRNDPTIRGSSRRSRIIAMSVPSSVRRGTAYVVAPARAHRPRPRTGIDCQCWGYTRGGPHSGILLNPLSSQPS